MKRKRAIAFLLAMMLCLTCIGSVTATNLHATNDDAGKNGVILNDGDDPVAHVARSGETYHVLYEFKSGTRGAGLIDPITEMLPCDMTAYAMGETVTAIMPEKTRLIGPQNTGSTTIGIWEFTGYDADSKVVSVENLESGADLSDTKQYIVFTGTWKFSTAYHVYYQFVPQDSSMTLPEGVRTQIPSDGMVKKGETISVPTSAFDRVEDTVDGEQGLWIFTGWDQETVESAAGDVTFTGTWKFVKEMPIEAVDLVAYEGGLGSNASTTTGDALPEPVWAETLEGHTISVDGSAWDMEAQGLPFDWKYLDENGTQVTTSARAGTYALTVYPLEGKEDSVVLVDDAYMLYLPEEGVQAGSVQVRDVTDDEAADNLSADVFKSVYNYDSPLAGARNLVKARIIGDFNENGTHDDECDPTQPHAHVQAGTTFYKNGNPNLPVNVDVKIGMLWDDLLEDVLGSEERMTALHEKSLHTEGMADVFDVDYPVRSKFQYIDLLDMNDGNVWVGTKDTPVTVYVPYSAEMTKDDQIAVTYFDGLTRDYTIQMDSADLDAEIAQSSAHFIKVTKTETGILFDVPSKEFGPFEILYQKKYQASYRFQSADQQMTLPQEITALLPNDTNSYVEGSTITAIDPSQKEIKTEQGVWTFTGWDAVEKSAGEDVTFIGTWTFTKKEAENHPETPQTPPKEDDTIQSNVPNSAPQKENTENISQSNTENMSTAAANSAFLWETLTIASSVVAGILLYEGGRSRKRAK